MHSLETIVERNERKAQRVLLEEAKYRELLAIATSLGALKELSDDDDAIGVVEAGTINGLILSMEACLKLLRQFIKVG